MAITKEEFLKAVGERISVARARKKLSPEALGKMIGLSRSSVTNIEAGRQAIQIFKLVQLAAALDEPVSGLIPTVSYADVVAEKVRQQASTSRSLSPEIGIYEQLRTRFEPLLRGAPKKGGKR